MSEDSKDCWQCRLISGGGLMAGGVYVAHHGRKLKSFSNHIVALMGYGLAAVGFLRMFALPPFKQRSHVDEKSTKTDEMEENEYIIGKFPSKF